jgi:L-ornithine N5-oxygenase
VSVEPYDAVVFATGYDFGHVEELLGELEPYVDRTADGAFAVRRDYSVRTDESFRPKIFLHGPTEHTHGLTSTLLSVLPHRAAAILDTAFGAAETADYSAPVPLDVREPCELLPGKVS